MPSKQGARLVTGCFGLGHLKGPAQLQDAVHSHVLNHAACLLLPLDHSDAAACTRHAAGSDRLTELSSYCHLVQCSLSALLQAEFLAKHGWRFQAVSVEPDAAGQAFAITPGRMCVLRVSAATYKCLGLTGRKAGAAHFIIEIDLASKNFKSGTTWYARVHDCLSQRLPPVRMLCLATDSQGVPVHPAFPAGVSVLNKPPLLAADSAAELGAPLPLFTAQWLQNGRAKQEVDVTDRPALAQRLNAVHTWLGGLACGAESDSLAMQGAPTVEDATLQRFSWQGMLSGVQVTQVLEVAKQAVLDGAAPWAALVVHGFAGAPVGWRSCDHVPGDEASGYVLLLMPQGECCVFRHMGSADVPVPVLKRVSGRALPG